MNIVFFGSVKFSYATLKHILNLPEANIVGIVTKRQSKFNADFYSLEPVALQEQIPYFIVTNDNNSELILWLKKINPDVIYCFGWSNLLSQDVLSSAQLGVIGYHPAALPRNRGRHPIIWALALGLSETASTFFFMDEGADSGDILSQEFVSISSYDDALSLYEKLTNTAVMQIGVFTTFLANRSFVRRPQDHSQANYWRKRNRIDGQIDWRMPTKGIYNLVRALSKPYNGAHCIWNGQEVKIWRSEIAEIKSSNIEPGKILNLEDGKLFVQTGDGIIILKEHEFNLLPEKGTYL